MDQQHEQTVTTLNQLYAAERRSLLPRLAETATFVSLGSAAEGAALQKMTAEENEHIEWLIEAIERAHGVVYPAGLDVHTGHLHYLDTHALLPLVIQSLESLVRLYQVAGSQMLTAPAAEVINRIARRHQAHLEQLRKFAVGAVAAASKQ